MYSQEEDREEKSPSAEYELIKRLFPDSFQGLIDCRRKAILDMTETTYCTMLKFKILGGRAKIMVTFTPEDV
jgi:hypothetical protein